MSCQSDYPLGTVLAQTVKRKFGPEMERLDDLAEAVDVVSSAIGTALYHVRQESSSAPMVGPSMSGAASRSFPSQEFESKPDLK